MGIHNVSVMGRGVDNELFAPGKRCADLRAQWGVTNSDTVLLYVGRIAEEKNLGLTIEAYYRLYELNNRLKFVLVGDGPMLKKLRKEHPSFIFAGNRTGEDLAAHFASGDIFLFSSLTETFGNVILEAMASGLGVVAFDYAAAHLHIEPDENGLLSRTGDAQGFLNNASRLMQNELLLKKLRINASKYAQQHSWSTIVEQFENILYAHNDDDEIGWDEELESLQQSN
jgi:glycosyltransferase involved in cell wall biosynthesis